MVTRLLALALAVTLAAGTAHAKEIEGVSYPEDLNVAGHSLKLVGVGLRSKWFVNVYTMGVYMVTPKKEARHIIRKNEPKMLWLRMLRTISGEKLRDAIDEGIERNSSEETRAKIKGDVDTFKSYFPEKVTKGLDIGFTYLPAKGTIVRIGGDEKGTIGGAQFMRALWAIWFGRKPADKDLKNGVLGE